MSRIIHQAVVLGTLLIMVHPAAQSGSLRITPTRIELDENRPAQVLTVFNSGSTRSLIQLSAFEWAQEGNEDDYRATDDIIASPPVFELVPGERQVIRVGLRKRDAARKHAAYRVYIQEVPTDPAPIANTLNMVLRIGVPLFVNPSDALPAALEWRLTCDDAERRILWIRNAGGKAAHILDLAIGNQHTVRALYVLSGAERAIEFSTSSADIRSFSIRASSDQGESHAQVACVA